MTDTYIVLDVETTGFSPVKNKIIEIAAVKYVDGVETEVFSTLVNPDCSIPSRITKLTGITPIDVQAAPCINEILPELHTFLGDYPIVAHNASFDRGFLEKAYLDFGYILTNRFIDTLALSRKCFPQLSTHKLPCLIEYFEIDCGPAHRALSDARATARLFEICNGSSVSKQTQPEEVEETIEIDPTSDESKFYSLIQTPLNAVVEKNNAPFSFVEFIATKSYYSYKYRKTIVFRVRFGPRSKWIEIPSDCRKIIRAHGYWDETDGDYVRLELSAPKQALDFEKMLCEILEHKIDSYPKAFSCCSRYVECSDAKKCIHLAREMAMDCFYRVNLKKGKIFFGENSILKARDL